MAKWDTLLSGIGIAHHQLPCAASPQSVEAAAEQAGVAVEQVVKAIAVLVDGAEGICLVPGDVRFKSSALAAAAGKSVKPIEAKRQAGPLSPLTATEQSLPLYIDGRLMDQEEVIIASGEPGVNLRIAADDLCRLSPTVSVVDLAGVGGAKGGRIEARVLKGFRDYLPEEMQPRQRMIDTIVTVFERFGFGPLQTPAIEYSDVLLGKYGSDAEKLLYRFRDNGGRDVSLRYDLTVPLSRVAGQYGNLPKPFKRYQVAPVWRAEKPGRGRFREFHQCDADIVGSSALIYDAECIALTYATMKALGIDEFEVRISTRKVLAALGEALSMGDDAQLATIFRTIDKLASQGEQRVRELLAGDAGCDGRQIDTVMRFVAISGDSAAILRQVGELLGPAAKEAGSDLTTVLGYVRSLGVPEDYVKLDCSIARGLDYYTGIVYETYVTALEGLGSVMSGGRYDDLITRFTGQPVPAVGVSVGIDRLFAGLIELGVIAESQCIVRAAVVACNAECVSPCLELLAQLRRAGISAETAFDNDQPVTLKRQLKAANKRGVPYVAILGPDEMSAGRVTLRDMDSGEQETIDLEEAIRRLSEA